MADQRRDEQRLFYGDADVGRAVNEVIEESGLAGSNGVCVMVTWTDDTMVVRLADTVMEPPFIYKPVRLPHGAEEMRGVVPFAERPGGPERIIENGVGSGPAHQPSPEPEPSTVVGSASSVAKLGSPVGAEVERPCGTGLGAPIGRSECTTGWTGTPDIFFIPAPGSRGPDLQSQSWDGSRAGLAVKDERGDWRVWHGPEEEAHAFIVVLGGDVCHFSLWAIQASLPWRLHETHPDECWMRPVYTPDDVRRILALAESVGAGHVVIP